MTTRDRIIHCRKFRNLTVRGFDSSIRITLPTVYSREFIPADESHIPSPETARSWPHLKAIAQHIPAIQACEIGLLIGYDCSQALAPKTCIAGTGNQPYAVKTDLGWSIVGRTSQQQDSFDAIGTTYKLVTKTVPDDLQLTKDKLESNIVLPDVSPEVHYVCITTVKERTFRPLDAAKLLEVDFNENSANGISSHSQNDLRFLEIISTGIRQQEDGHYVMPLPFKNEKPLLPNNVSK
jgi:hypothetical protein